MFSLRALVVSIVLSSVFGCVPATSDFSAPDSRQNRQFTEAKQEKLQAVPSPQILPTPSSTPPPSPQTDPAPSASPGVYISLAEDLKPQEVKNEKTYKQSRLLRSWTRSNEVAKYKKFALGSKSKVSADKNSDKGFFSTILAAYNNHWVLKTRPEDWWTTIAQIIATRIDKVATRPAVRKFFVSHEGKKKLTVEIGPTIAGIDDEAFFQQMTSQISRNINKPEYTSLMATDFSQSTSVDRIINSIMLMYSFKEYFEYRAMMLCGLPGVSMLGTEEDWSRLVEKLEKVEEFLQPIEDELELGGWFNSSRVVLNNLLETYQGNPDKDWWSRIMDIHVSYGSGGGTTVSGWFVTSFLGVWTGDLKDVPSGVNVVPLTLTDGTKEEQSALAAGLTGYTIAEEDIVDPNTNTTFPSVQAAHGWALLIDEDSVFN